MIHYFGNKSLLYYNLQFSDYNNCTYIRNRLGQESYKKYRDISNLTTNS